MESLEEVTQTSCDLIFEGVKTLSGHSPHSSNLLLQLTLV